MRSIALRDETNVNIASEKTKSPFGVRGINRNKSAKKPFEVKLSIRGIDNGTVIISANKEGLLSLAAQLTELAETQPGSHIHYDEFNSLDEGSAEMIIAHSSAWPK